VVSKRAIQPPVSDNKKLSLKQYKQLIYDRIKKIYSDEPPLENKKSASSIHRATEVMREKTNEYRQSFNSQKHHKVATSTPKSHPLQTHTVQSHPLQTHAGQSHAVQSNNSLQSHAVQSTSGSYSTINTSVLNDDDKEKLRKKQSLKDILKNKREKSALRADKSEAKLDTGKYDSAYHYAKEYNKYGNSPVLAKYYKAPPAGPKENRLYGKY
jgi:hypothetical protein